MAKYVVKPGKKHPLIVKCDSCGTMFVPEKMNGYWTEPCPVCSNEIYAKYNRIPLWRYNLIRWFRGELKDENN